MQGMRSVAHGFLRPLTGNRISGFCCTQISPCEIRSNLANYRPLRQGCRCKTDWQRNVKKRFQAASRNPSDFRVPGKHFQMGEPVIEEAPFPLTDTDRFVLSQTDEEFEYHTWDDLRRLIRTIINLNCISINNL